ncbi:MAG: hypothetical protein WEC84_01485 [Candidatus Andersenbacteria bacterium]
MTQLPEQFARRAILISGAILLLIAIVINSYHRLGYSLPDLAVSQLLHPVGFLFYELPLPISAIMFFVFGVWHIFFFSGSRRATIIAVAIPWVADILSWFLALQVPAFFVLSLITTGIPILLLNIFAVYLRKAFIAGGTRRFIFLLSTFVLTLTAFSWIGLGR